MTINRRILNINGPHYGAGTGNGNIAPPERINDWGITLSNSNTTINFNIDSNLPPSITVRYEFVNVVNGQFIPGSGNATLDSNSNVIISSNLDVAVGTGVTSIANLQLRTEVANTIIANSPDITISDVDTITATGGTITTFDRYKVHTFNSNSAFTISDLGNSVSTDQIDLLLVGGGGNGGGGFFDRSTDASTLVYQLYPGGGGGAGGVLEANTVVGNIGISTNTVTVGAGAPASQVSGSQGSPAGDSQFKDFVAGKGGNGGVNGDSKGARFGGSGGGNSSNNLSPSSFPDSDQGNSGNLSIETNRIDTGIPRDPPFSGTREARIYSAGGGGGFGEDGESAYNYLASGNWPLTWEPNVILSGSGGDGAISNITGSNVYYGGGGPGGVSNTTVVPNEIAGSLGGGGKSVVQSPSTLTPVTDGTDGFGGGGAGGSAVVDLSMPSGGLGQWTYGGAGGDGVVIIKYAATKRNLSI